MFYFYNIIINPLTINTHIIYNQFKPMYHYVYRITNLVKNKHYYGKRKSIIDPNNDLGVKYFSSSSDKDFIKDQKDNPQNYKYKIIRTFKSSKDALEFEIKLHNKFDVGVNESFYNKSKQISVGFDNTGKTGVLNPMYGRTGFKHSEETKLLYSNTRKGNKNSMFGKTHTIETKEKISKANKGRVISQETKDMISKSNKGKTHSEETKHKISNSKLGKPLTEHHKEKLSLIKKLQEKVLCCFCNNLFDAGNYTRWHGLKCKLNPQDII